jgi:hypothetical protein
MIFCRTVIESAHPTAHLSAKTFPGKTRKQIKGIARSRNSWSWGDKGQNRCALLIRLRSSLCVQWQSYSHCLPIHPIKTTQNILIIHTFALKGWWYFNYVLAIGIPWPMTRAAHKMLRWKQQRSQWIMGHPGSSRISSGLLYSSKTILHNYHKKTFPFDPICPFY